MRSCPISIDPKNREIASMARSPSATTAAAARPTGMHTVLISTDAMPSGTATAVSAMHARLDGMPSAGTTPKYMACPGSAAIWAAVAMATLPRTASGKMCSARSTRGRSSRMPSTVENESTKPVSNIASGENVKMISAARLSATGAL